MSRLTDTVRTVVWPRRGTGGRAAWLALQPASALFGAGVALRDLGYRVGLLPSARARVGVVSVGNLSVGGTGKTPITLWLARQLAADGTRVAILLRGYAGLARQPTIVSRGDGPLVDVDVAGDEATMLAKCFDGFVLTARRRVDGAALAADLGCQVVVLDDGFQHRALQRDFDLVLIDGGPGSLLPAGPMREPWSALERADAVAFVRKLGSDDSLPNLQEPRPSTPTSIPFFRVRFIPTTLVASDSGRWHERKLTLLSGARVAVVCGIARPGPFYAAVRQWEATITEIYEYADHHRYSTEDWQRIARGTRDVDWIVTTEKDLVKLERFPFAKEKLVALRIGPEVEDGDDLVGMIRGRLRKPGTENRKLETEN